MGVIVVAAYKDGAPETVAPYRAVCNRRPDGSEPQGYEFYDSLENLARFNHSYCELSAFSDSLEYFRDENWLGLSHYRRMFVSDSSKNPFNHMPKISYSNSKFLEKYKVDESSWNSRMSVNDVVLARRERMFSLGYGNSYEQFVQNHPPIYFDFLHESVNQLFPKMPSFIDYHKNNLSLSFYNMVVARKELVIEYANFLFPVLKECEKYIGFEQGGYQGRWAGFLGERLLNYWFDSITCFKPLKLDFLTVAIENKPNAKIPISVKNSRRARKFFRYI
jgi:hypothetical protein